MHHATTPEGAAMVVLPREDYDRLIANREDASDAALLDMARDESVGAPVLTRDLLSAVLDGTLHPLTAWRKAAGLSMKALAAKAGIRQATISDIENARIDPRWSTVKALADALGVEADDIM